MSYTIKPILSALLLAALLSGCAAPPFDATESIPTSTPPPPTQAAPTKTPPPVKVQVEIPVNTERFTGSFPATMTGNGSVGFIFANTEVNDPSEWQPLVDALDGNENLRMATFAFRDVHSTSFADTRAVFDYLRANGIDKVICIGSYYGAGACADLRTEPEIIGMVFFPSPIIPFLQEDFPKLFLTADADPSGYAGILQQVYERSAEPKIFKSYSSGRHGPALFTDPEVGSQALADVVLFINEIVNGQ